MLLPPIAFVEGLIANLPFYLNRKRAMFGHNFCCAGEVVMEDFATLERALTEPQARTYRLGMSFLNEKHVLVNGRSLFALALSDPQITKKEYTNGIAHADVLKLVKDHVLNEKALQRQQDATVSYAHSQASRDLALKMGAADERAMALMLQEDRRKYLHFSRRGQM